MKKIRLNDPVVDIFGALYEVNLTRSPREEEDEIKNTPHKCIRIPASEAQKARRQLFKQAIAYSKAALADPELRAYYEAIAQQQRKHPKDVAFSDRMKGNDLLSVK